MESGSIGGNSAESRDIAALAHPYSDLRRHLADGPLVITGGAGVVVVDQHGKRYIEAMAGLWCASLGFGERRLVDAASHQMQRLPFYHLFNHKSHDPAIELGTKLLALAPVPMSKVLFANSGSEANDTAIKLIWYFNNANGRPEKKKIISRHRAYHGVSVATTSLTGLPNNHRDFDLPLPGFLHTDCPHFWRYGEKGESEEDFATRMANALDALIIREGPETVAAFFAEPVMGAGGVILPPRTYFEKVQQVLKQHDVLFVVDEVICGFGRTGKMFASQTYDLKPDMLVLAKALSAGYLPISALLISEEIWQAMLAESDRIGGFAHGFTYSGHPVAAAVALETLAIYEERDILGHIRKVTPRFAAGLAAFAGHPLVGDVRSVGLMGAIELVADRETRAPLDPADRIPARIIRAAEEHGVITRAMGDVIAFSPPLVISAAEIDEMFCRFGRALEDVTKK